MEAERLGISIFRSHICEQGCLEVGVFLLKSDKCYNIYASVIDYELVIAHYDAQIK